MIKFTMVLMLILLVSIQVQSQTQTDSLRINEIDKTLREYGKQQTIANKITIVSIITIGVGTIIGIPAEPLLVINTLADLVTIMVSSKSNRKLSKHQIPLTKAGTSDLPTRVFPIPTN